MICKQPFFLIPVILLVVFLSVNGPAQDEQQNQLLKAKLLITEGQYIKSNDILQKLIETEPENIDVLYYMGLNYQAISNFNLSSIMLEKALIQNPENVTLMTLLGNNYYSAGRISDADSILTAAFFKDSTDSQILLSLGKVYKQERFWAKAERIYFLLVNSDSSNSFYYEQLAYCNVALKDTNNAVINFQIAHKLNPLNQNTVLELSQLYISQERLISAMHIVDNGLKAYPASSLMWAKKADINLKMKNYTDAILEYQTSIGLGDSSEVYFRNIGICYYWTGEYDSSIIFLNQAIKIMDKDPAAYFYLGTAYKGLKQFDKAIENLSIAIKLQRNDFLAEALIQTAATYYEQKDYSNALKFYQDALRENQNKNEIVFYLATVYDHYYKDKTVAINYYKKFLSNKEEKTDEKLLVYAEKRINLLIEENHFRKIERPN